MRGWYSICPEGCSFRGFFMKELALIDTLPKGTPRFIRRSRRWFVPMSLLLGLAGWHFLAASGWWAPFILPGPLQVAGRFWQALIDGTLIRHTAATLLEVSLGLLAGSLTATVLGYLIARSPALERLLAPYLVASQAVPVVAIAPLLVIWFGPGLFSKVLICALIVFFPVLVNTVVGLRAVPQNLRDLMRSFHATRWQTLRYLEIPAALPVFLGGLRIGATLSVIGAVVGEFIGADRGLGFLINVARGQYDTALVFAVVLTLVGMALGLYGLVLLLERRLLAWQSHPE
ncbi:ABC-type nitrate/sulfonate/bicarbonate transport system, permease component [Anaerolinea thermolimosa]|uniref:ABC-type nitrate/sulfonate/bicarbonate transport system, permease component n=2 Tax=Anaerolinea thermolimosa TaxID=229919 RepID=A0A7U9KMU3_9CHLR|nr:ABC-type nitrate/sulfonate/bicarbonate transport system, permease component [Anaerolinea thermolimosa]GAP08755.1 ABC-type nitrate/sulfonate/bicarbonate transport system, permease component [Anaerolinea thermolimosa]